MSCLHWAARKTILNHFHRLCASYTLLYMLFGLRNKIICYLFTHFFFDLWNGMS